VGFIDSCLHNRFFHQIHVLESGIVSKGRVGPHEFQKIHGSRELAEPTLSLDLSSESPIRIVRQIRDRLWQLIRGYLLGLL
jgi:hypothetical protein